MSGPEPFAAEWSTPPAPAGLIPIEQVALRCGKPVEWALRRCRDLPTVRVTGAAAGIYVDAADLRVWLRAAVDPPEQR